MEETELQTALKHCYYDVNKNGVKSQETPLDIDHKNKKQKSFLLRKRANRLGIDCLASEDELEEPDRSINPP